MGGALSGVCHADRAEVLHRIARMGKKWCDILEDMQKTSSPKRRDFKEEELCQLETDLVIAARELANLPDCSD